MPVKKKKKKRKTVSFQQQQVNMAPGGSNSLDNSYSSNIAFNPQQNQENNFQNENMLNLNIVPSIESDSDSDITTDVDLNDFERSISM